MRINKLRRRSIIPFQTRLFLKTAWNGDPLPAKNPHGGERTKVLDFPTPYQNQWARVEYMGVSRFLRNVE